MTEMFATDGRAIPPVSMAVELRKPLVVSSLRDLHAKQVFAIQNLLLESVGI